MRAETAGRGVPWYEFRPLADDVSSYPFILKGLHYPWLCGWPDGSGRFRSDVSPVLSNRPQRGPGQKDGVRQAGILFFNKL